MKLFHVSENPCIEKFIPRYSARIDKSIVWAISEPKLVNYLLPRDCPRICFSTGDRSLPSDCHRLLGSSEQVIAIESNWYERAIETSLYLYEMPCETFTLFDSIAGYYVSQLEVVPTRLNVIKQPVKEIVSRNVELRILPTLWQLHDDVVNSTLNFSVIRMKHARPRI